MRITARCLLLSTLCLAVSVAWADEGRERDRGVVIVGKVVTTHYDGITDDLLTAGLGKTGLQGPTPVVNAAAPTTAQLRQLAIYNNYRALVDVVDGGGYGLFWGPNVRADGTVTTGAGLVAGDETLAFAQQADGSFVTLMVQVPDSFDPARACIVAAPSSGSRGVYGAIATAGEWGLKNGCAVAYTDKGSGTGFDDLQKSLVTTLQGEVVPISGGAASQFTAAITAGERAAFDAALPNRFAFKHAHSQVNPEAAWGQYVLQSVRFAFRVLNEKFPGRVDRRHTVVIASSVSNGGGASIRAAEQDEAGLIDGVAVAEPNVNPVYGRFAIQQGSQRPFAGHSRTLIDYVTLQNVYDACAIADPRQTLLLNPFPSAARCASLHTAGLLKAADLAGQAQEAQTILNDFGILPEQNALEGVMWFSSVPQSIAVTYANAYGRFGVTESLCGYSFGAADSKGTPVALAATAENLLFGTSNGIPPTGGVSLINNLVGQENRVSTLDQNLAGALCLRSLAIGRDAVSGAPLSRADARRSERIEEEVERILATGDLHGTPTIIVTGRSDDILPPNFASRAYVGLNQLREGRGSQVRYIEVKNAQHLDTLLGIAGFNQRYLPLHRYFVQAMDLMFAHLTTRAALPPSQVIQTVPRGVATPTTAPAITAANVPPIVATPGANAITFDARVLRIPE